MSVSKYEPEAQILRHITKARGAVVVIAAGERGSGYAFNGILEDLVQAPKALREIADQIEQELKKRAS